MNAKLKRKWIKALRSGEYKQAECMLLDQHGAMCCLGVLADIQGVDWSAIPTKLTSNLPRGFNGGLKRNQRQLLAHKNDGSGNEDHRHTFAEIADYIDKHL